MAHFKTPCPRCKTGRLFLEDDLYIIGTPEFAISEIERYRDDLGATEIVCWMHLPGIPGDDVMTSVELFAREVMPAFPE